MKNKPKANLGFLASLALEGIISEMMHASMEKQIIELNRRQSDKKKQGNRFNFSASIKRGYRHEKL